ncbi:MAG: alpha/beta hydrolase [Dehalococcoidia bacterium]
MEDLGPFAIPNTHSHDLVAASNGQPYRVWVATPAKREPGKVRPVLYMTDANSDFGTVTEASRLLAFAGQIPPVIVVGIGYGGPKGFRDQMTFRNFELTPTVDEKYIERVDSEGHSVGPNGLGGSAGFLQFIEQELAPMIEETYGGDPADRGLFGFSLGGLFTTWAMLQPNTSFKRFVAGSPSLWWHNRMMFGLEEERAAGPKELRARLFISAGEDEEGPARPDTAQFRMVSNAIELASALSRRKYEGLSIDLQIIRGAGHEQAPMIVQGLRSVYSKTS